MVELRKGYQKLMLVDDREPMGFVELLAENTTIPIEFRRLRTGDYVVDDVAVERKNLKDFVSSMISKKKRLWNQYDRLKKEFRYPYIVINGRIKDLDTQVSTHAILGGMAYCGTHGITTIKIDGGNEDLAYLILKIFENHGKLCMPSELHRI